MYFYLIKFILFNTTASFMQRLEHQPFKNLRENLSRKRCQSGGAKPWAAKGWSESNIESIKDAISFKQNRAHNEMKQNLKKFFIQGTFPKFGIRMFLMFFYWVQCLTMLTFGARSVNI